MSIPKELAQRIAKLETDAYVAWVGARKDSDFSKFAPFLQQWVDVNQQKAAAIDPTKPVYDVLLDDYEKGMTAARLDEIFAEVGAPLSPVTHMRVAIAREALLNASGLPLNLMLQSNADVSGPAGPGAPYSRAQKPWQST